MKTFRYLVTIALSLVVSNAIAQADQYQFSMSQPTFSQATCADIGSPDTAGHINSIQTTFDSATNEFSWSMNLTPCGTSIANAFWLVVNNGPMPHGHAGEVAVIYFIPDSVTNDPVITVNAYNGSPAGGFEDGDIVTPGIQPPDRILSSLVSTDWIIEKSMVDEADGSRTFKFRIDATAIVNHTPVYPHPVDPWYGVGFDTLIGFWVRPMANTFGEYCTQNDSNPICQSVAAGQDSVGYLKGGGLTAFGVVDASSQSATQVPKDCKGVPNGTAVVDRCGVCDGDGMSCLLCEQENIAASQLVLDGGALAQKRKVEKATNLLLKKDSSAETKAYVSQVRAKAQQLYIDNWSIVWAIPSVQTTCTGSVACATIDNTASISQYQSKAKELRDLANQVLKRLGAVTGSAKIRKKLRVEIKNEYKTVLEATNAVPALNSQCS